MPDVPGTYSEADSAYFNGTLPKFGTQSSTLVSASKYLNCAPLRDMTAQEMLRRNGPDISPTAFIPEIYALLNQLEDWPRITQLFEQEKARLPLFREWCNARRLSLFKREELEGAKPGTLRAFIYDFAVNSGYQVDYFFQGMEIRNDIEFWLKERSLSHDIEHMITGFETDCCGEVALATANTRAFYGYFVPELAAFFDRLTAYLGAAKTVRSNLYYPEVVKTILDANDMGAAQGRSWKHPLFMIPYYKLLDWAVTDIREEYGITDVQSSGVWTWTTAAYEDPRQAQAAVPSGLAA